MSYLKKIIYVFFIFLSGGIIGGLIILNNVHEKLEKIEKKEEKELVENLEKQSLNDTLHINECNKDIDKSRYNAIVSVIKNNENAVVTVSVTQVETFAARRSTGDPLFDLFFNPPMLYQRKVHSLGSGIIINKDGYIITNEHVIKDATEIKVTLPDRREYIAKIVGFDNQTDIAVLKIYGNDFPYVILGNSDDIYIGEWAIALGNPFGYLLNDPHPTATVGVISAINRTIQPGEDGKIYHNMIQTDASINPGNSGGPLFNAKGEVIGINTFILSKTGGSVGLGFAIPINFVKKIVKELIKYGKVRDLWLGIRLQDLDKYTAYQLGYNKTNGVVVTYVEENSPADKVLKLGDIIINVNSNEINDINDIRIALVGIQPGDKMDLTVWRSGKIVKVKMEAKSK